MSFGGCNGVIEEVRRGLRAHGPVIEDREAVLALNGGFGCERHGNEMGRHVAVKGDRGPDQRAHGRQARVLKESAPVRVRAAAEQELVGCVRVLLVEFGKLVRGGAAAHCHAPCQLLVRGCSEWDNATLRPCAVSRYF